MEPWGRIAVISVIVLIAGVFALLNSGEMVTVYLGVTTLYRISLVWLIFSAFLAGMVTMMLVSLGHDLRLRRLLREHGILEFPGTQQAASEAEPTLLMDQRAPAPDTDAGERYAHPDSSEAFDQPPIPERSAHLEPLDRPELANRSDDAPDETSQTRGDRPYS